MNECKECNQVSRRTFLRRAGIGLGAVAMADPLLNMVASTFAQTAAGTGNQLVLCQLAGGMDALSFLAPFTNQVYIDRRPQLALGANDVTPLPDDPEYGICNLFPFFSELYAQGQLSIVQQVAFPNSNGSHFESQEVYEFGVRNLGSGVGTSASWYERLRRTYFDEPFGVLDTRAIGDPRRYGYPDQTFRRASEDAFGRLSRLIQGRNPVHQGILDTYTKIDTISADIQSRTENFTSTGPSTGEFFRAAMLASANLGTQVLKLRYGGYDTHGNQDTANLTLFPVLDSDFRQFVDDMKAQGMWDRTCVIFYTEFGRRNEENGSPGTDHGYGGHMMLAGPRVRGGLHGQSVTTADLNQRNLPYYVDFRDVFSCAIRDWLGFNPDPIFKIDGEAYDETIGAGSLFT